MRVGVRLFAMQRVQTGKRLHALDLPEGADVAAAWAALVADFPALAPARASVRFARNGRYVEADAELAPDDELAVIPPVAGGADPGETSLRGPEDDPRIRHVAITEGPLDGVLDALRGEIASARGWRRHDLPRADT